MYRVQSTPYRVTNMLIRKLGNTIEVSHIKHFGIFQKQHCITINRTGWYLYLPHQVQSTFSVYSSLRNGQEFRIDKLGPSKLLSPAKARARAVIVFALYTHHQHQDQLILVVYSNSSPTSHPRLPVCPSVFVRSVHVSKNCQTAIAAEAKPKCV